MGVLGDCVGWNPHLAMAAIMGMVAGQDSLAHSTQSNMEEDTDTEGSEYQCYLRLCKRVRDPIQCAKNCAATEMDKRGHWKGRSNTAGARWYSREDFSLQRTM